MEQKTLLQVIISTIVVLAFIGVLAVLSTMFTANGVVTKSGGYALVAALVGFVFVMSGAGVWITQREGDGDAS